LPEPGGIGCVRLFGTDPGINRFTPLRTRTPCPGCLGVHSDLDGAPVQARKAVPQSSVRLVTGEDRTVGVPCGGIGRTDPPEYTTFPPKTLVARPGARPRHPGTSGEHGTADAAPCARAPSRA